MKNVKFFRFASRLLLFASLIVSRASSQQIPAIVSDPPPDKDFPASVEAPDIISQGTRLNAVFYLPSGRGPNPVVLLLHGFPGNEQNMDLAYTLRRAGWSVLVPHYRGSWGSAGVFSFANAIEDTQSSVQFLRDPANVKKYRIDPKKIVLIGHSMGGFMVADAAARDPQILGLAMLSAWNIGASMNRPSAKDRIPTFLNAAPRLPGTTAETLVAEALHNAENWDYLKFAAALKSRPVLITEAVDRNVDDNKAMAQALRKVGNPHVTEIAMKTDHSYSDHRIALQTAVLHWLQTEFTRSLP